MGRFEIILLIDNDLAIVFVLLVSLESVTISNRAGIQCDWVCDWARELVT